MFDSHPSQQVHAYHVLKRAGNKKILLCKPQTLPDFGLIIRVKDLANCFGYNLLIDSSVIIPRVE
jgi:hypothetical protein